MNRHSSPKLHREFIHPEALKITENLQRAGFTTYLVGGCVRDLLANIQPKDFDIATNANPRQVKKNISDAYIIGKRFRLVLVKRGGNLFEVATFRRDPKPEDVQITEENKHFGDNIFGTPEEDAKRRDFTLNAIFYDPIKDELIDFCEGIRDIKQHTVRMIGDPYLRLKEDPIRILRALRLAHKLEYTIETNLRKAMKDLSSTLKNSVLPRRREEVLKILRLKDPALALMEAHDLGIIEEILPSLKLVYLDSQKTEDFNYYMNRIHDFVLDSENPAELFGYLLLSFYRSVFQPDPLQKMNSQDFLKEEKIKNFMHNELGMYNVEQAMTAKALELQFRIRKVDNPKKELLYGDSIPLAIMMAKADYVLSSEKLMSWEAAIKDFSKEFNNTRHRKKSKR